MAFDNDSRSALTQLEKGDWAKLHRIAGVRTVLLVLSSSGLVFDLDSLRHKILSSYPDATVFFVSTQGISVGAPPPLHVDLLIDLTGPGQRQSGRLPRSWRRKARVAVGRNTCWIRRRIYDVVFDEKAEKPGESGDPALRELSTQRKVLGLAGVVVSPSLL